MSTPDAPSTSSSKQRSSHLLLGIVIVAALTVVITLIAGNYRDRWRPSMERQEAGNKLKDIPLRIGDWIANEEKEMLQDEIETLQIGDNYIYRRYINAKTNEEVILILMVGPPGRLTVHSPEICFGGRNYVKENNRVPVSFPVAGNEDGPEDTLWRVLFNNKSIRGGSSIVFYYGLNVGFGWRAVEDPRTEFQWYRNIYKIQVQSYARDAKNLVGTQEVNASPDPVHAFLTEAFPVIREHLALKSK